MYLANPLTKRILLVFRQIQDVFNPSSNCVSRSSVKATQVCPRFKLKCASSLKLDSQYLSSLKSCFSLVARQLLDRQAAVEVHEKLNSSSVLTPICDYMFRLSFSQSQTYKRIILRAVKVLTSCTSVEQSLFKQIVTGDKICLSSSFL